ncbi:hypothetical protein JMUB6875_57280 [Nocardia sp. JMUB6875]
MNTSHAGLLADRDNPVRKPDGRLGKRPNRTHRPGSPSVRIRVKGSSRKGFRGKPLRVRALAGYATTRRRVRRACSSRSVSDMPPQMP